MLACPRGKSASCRRKIMPTTFPYQTSLQGTSQSQCAGRRSFGACIAAKLEGTWANGTVFLPTRESRLTDVTVQALLLVKLQVLAG
jgi:hypothetical protein